jgi:hypothetical protein
LTKNKIRDLGGPLTLDGCHLMERLNDQPKDGSSNGLEVGAMPSWAISLGEDVILLFGVKVSNKKITKIK